MIKALTFLAIAIPVFLFVRTVFFRRSAVVRKAASDFDRQIGYLAWGIVILVAIVAIFTFLQPLFRPV